MEKLLEYFNQERGRRFKLAELLGIRPGAISQWKDVPLKRVRAISEATGLRDYELRPDIFDTPEKVNEHAVN